MKVPKAGDESVYYNNQVVKLESYTNTTASIKTPDRITRTVPLRQLKTADGRVLTELNNLELDMLLEPPPASAVSEKKHSSGRR